MRRFLLSITAILLACCQPIVAQGKGWRGIVPLQSTRADVERLLGPGTNGHYQFEAERVHVNYAGEGRCNPVNGCLCFVTKDTVISIYVQLEVEMRFSKLNIDKKKYEKFVSPKDPNVATYTNDKEGIIYTVNEENDDVTAIEYLPTAKDCQNVIRRAKRAGVQLAPRNTMRTLVKGPSSSLALFPHSRTRDVSVFRRTHYLALYRHQDQKEILVQNLPRPTLTTIWSYAR